MPATALARLNWVPIRVVLPTVPISVETYLCPAPSVKRTLVTSEKYVPVIFVTMNGLVPELTVLGLILVTVGVGSEEYWIS